MIENYFLEDFILNLIELGNQGKFGIQSDAEYLINDVIKPRLKIMEFYENKTEEISSSIKDKIIENKEEELEILRNEQKCLFRLFISDIYEIIGSTFLLYLGKNGCKIGKDNIKRYNGKNDFLGNYRKFIDKEKNKEIELISSIRGNIEKIRTEFIHYNFEEIFVNSSGGIEIKNGENNYIKGNCLDSIKVIKRELRSYFEKYKEILNKD